jgi:hypothetical protein
LLNDRELYNLPKKIAAVDRGTKVPSGTPGCKEVSGERTRAVRAISTFAPIVMAVSSLALFPAVPANAQSNQNPGFGVGNVQHGLVVGVAVGVAAAAGIGITYLVIHKTVEVVAGCIAESSEKRLS